MGLTLQRRHLDAIFAHGQETYPHECCGLLLGRGGQDSNRLADDIVRMRNANTDRPQDRFIFDPKEHIAAQRDARTRGLEIIGFYHSHPDHPARPSRFDLDHASWPGYSYVIVSILAGKPGDANSFELAEDRSRFLSETLSIQS